VGDLLTTLPSYFGFAGVRAVKERGAFFIEGGKIHRTNSTPQEILAHYDLVKKIEQAGFLYADVIIPATTGMPFVALGRDVFVMTRHMPGREPDMTCAADVKRIIESLAHFHNAARGLAEVEITTSPPLTETFAKQLSMLNGAVKTLNRRPRLSDFDVMVLKNADAYLRRIETAIDALSRTAYGQLYAAAIANNHVCHASLKEETFTLAEENCYISRFENAEIDLQLADLASILCRYARKSQRETSLADFIAVYDKISPLPAGGEKIIGAMLIFPQTFLKSVSQFYSKKRNFIPAAITERMTGVLAEQDAYDAWVKS